MKKTLCRRSILSMLRLQKISRTRMQIEVGVNWLTTNVKFGRIQIVLVTISSSVRDSPGDY
jgi:hypothetical protein